jgi:transcriptional regulator with XRE-family HTH domain
MEVSMAAGIRLRTGQYRKYAALKGWKTNAQAAAAIRVTEPTIGRILSGKRGPGEQFIAALLAALPELDFADLFEVVAAEDERVPA